MYTASWAHAERHRASAFCTSSSSLSPLSSSSSVTCLHAPHTPRGPIGSSTEDPSDRVRMRAHANF
eukprot:4768324-Pyramimonas_sp.AAC.1